MNKISVVITARGAGARMKCLSPKPKHLLYYRDKRIVDHIREALEFIGPVEVLEGGPDGSRKETLELLRGRKEVLICDCDVIPKVSEAELGLLKTTTQDAIYCFNSNNPKYGGLYAETSLLKLVVEKGDTQTDIRASGLYFIRDIDRLLERMTDPNSIASGMIGARIFFEDSFIRLGDPEDYLANLK